ncbi:hypothetical protein DSO57_1015308 [Entomophthora muscae]|uniref:Uncharacterized protein n=1 Tax=Entomophthora muscae TaxID=34485 RepID=A0ACC2TGA3_9FUNG|nr:hypothetical protein DSO57_1015308 [Entomophthora muscae]
MDDALPSLLMAAGDVWLTREIFVCPCAVGPACPTISSWLGAKCWWSLPNVCNQMENNKYKLITPLVLLSTPKCPHSTPSHCFILHLPVDGSSSEDAINKDPNNEPSPSGSRHCPSA